MSNIFGGIKKSDDAKRKDDRVGGGSPILSGAYPAKVVMAYIREAADSKSQTKFLVTEFELQAIDGSDKTLKLTEDFMVCGKDGKNYWENETHGKNNFSGYDNASDLAAFTAGKLLEDLETEEKTVEVYDRETKTKVYKTVTAFPELAGVDITVLVQRQLQNKQAKNEKTGEWHDIADTFEKPVVDFICDTDGFTFNERAAEKEQPEFINLWKTANDGKVSDRTNKKLAKANEESTKEPAKKASIFGAKK